MGDAKTVLKSTLTTLAVIWLMNQFAPTRQLVQSALTGN